MLPTRFVGRFKELEVLKKSWVDASNGVPQIVNLIADTGVGKTRIIHEFYSWLSIEARQASQAGKKSYWPDTLGVHRQRSVNPNEEQFGTFDFKHDVIPWLWWGMYWTDVDGEQVSALTQFSGYLSNHLIMLELEEKSKKKNLNAFWQMVADEGFDIVSDFVPGISQVKKLATFFLKMKARRDEKNQLSRGRSAEQERLLDEMQDGLLCRLDKLYAQRENKLVVPFILFLDDIHFASDKLKDSETLNFLEKLLNRAIISQWPLLVITTHWKNPWQAHLHDKSFSKCKPWRLIVEGLREQHCDDLLKVQNIEIYNIEKSELDKVIQSTLLGLLQSDRTLILNRIDNIRWLVEVLTALNDNVDHFENRDRNQTLSKYGLQKLDELLKSNGYMDVIRQRLSSDIMTPIRPILGAVAWNAYGLNFLSPLIQPIGRVLFEKKVLDTQSDNLEKVVYELVLKAIDPSAFLKGSLPTYELANLLSFSERGYLDVARELFDNSHLPSVRQALAQEIIAWLKTDAISGPRWHKFEDVIEQRTFLEIARKVLQELMPKLTNDQESAISLSADIIKKRVTNGRMTQEEMDEEIYELRRTFLSENASGAPEDTEAWYVCCTIELIMHLCISGEARAYELAFQLCDSGLLVKSHYQLVSSDALLELVRVLQDKKTCLVHAKEIADFLIEKNKAINKTPQEIMRLSRVLVIQADIEKESGNLKAAQKGYFSSLYSLEGLLEKYGDTSVLLMDLSLILRRIGGLKWKSGDSIAAHQYYVNSLEIAKRLLVKYGESAERLINQCISVERLAGIELASNNLHDAQKGFERCLEIFERLGTEYGETAQILRSRGITAMHLADLHKRREDLAAARQYYELSETFLIRIITHYGTTSERIRDLNIINTRLADLDLYEEQTYKAYWGYKKSLEVIKHLLGEYGEKSEWLSDKILVLMRLASLEQIYDDLEVARKSYAICQTVARKLIEQYGETPERLEDLRITLRLLGDLDQKKDEFAAARENYEESLELGERLLAKYGETYDLLREQYTVLIHLANFDKENGNFMAARKHYQQCQKLSARLLNQYGDRPDLLRDQYILQMHLAELNKASGNLEAAERSYLQSLTLSEGLLEQHSGKSEILIDRSITLKNLGELQLANNDLIAARKSFELCLEIDKHLITKYGETLERMQQQKISQKYIADLEYISGNVLLARQGFQECLELAVQIYNEYVDSPETLMGLYLSFVRLADLDIEIGDCAKALEGYENGLKIIEYLIERYGEMMKLLQLKSCLCERMASIRAC